MINLTPNIENAAKGYTTLLLMNTINEMCSQCPAGHMGTCEGAPQAIAYACSNHGVVVLFEMDGGKVHFGYFVDGETFIGPGDESSFGFTQDDEGNWTFAPGFMADEVWEKFHGEPSKN